MPRDPPVHDSSGIIKNHDFAHFLSVFVGCSPQFLGPGRISMPRDPRYMTLAASSKLVISRISGRFHGL